MRKVFIYILVDPRQPETIRYVGQALTPLSRHIQHCCESGQSAKCQWIECIRLEGVMPLTAASVLRDSNDALRRSGVRGGALQHSNRISVLVD